MNRRNCISRHGNCNRPAANFRKTSHSRQSHIVGYNTINVQANRLFGYGVQFTEVSGLEEIPVKDIISVDVPKGANTIGDTADQIWLYDTTAMDWKKFFYRTQRTTVYGWCDAAGNVLDETTTMKNGDGFFFKRASSADGKVTISGAIKATDATPIALSANRLHFVCNRWPIQLKVSDFAAMVDVPNGANTIGDTADQIWLYDTNTMEWKKYFYRTQRTTVYGWCDETGTVVTDADVIPVGCGFFFKRASSADGNLSFVKPTL